MGKTSKNIAKGLGEAIKEAQSLINSSNPNVEDLLNSGAEVAKKRKRKSKAEKEVDAQQQTNTDIEDVSEQEPDNRPEWEKRNASNHDEFCDWELQKAHIYNYEDPDFDYRNYYSRGNIVYYIRVFEPLGEKELMKLTLRTIYPRTLIGTVEKGYCQCISYNQKDRVFNNYSDALDCFNKTIVSSKYGNEYDENTGKKKRKRKPTEEEYDEESASDEYLQKLMTEEEE